MPLTNPSPNYHIDARWRPVDELFRNNNWESPDLLLVAFDEGQLQFLVGYLIAISCCLGKEDVDLSFRYGSQQRIVPHKKIRGWLNMEALTENLPTVEGQE